MKCESENEAIVGAQRSQFKNHQLVRMNELIKVVHTDKGNVEELSPGWHMDGASSIKGGGSAEESGEE